MAKGYKKSIFVPTNKKVVGRFGEFTSSRGKTVKVCGIDPLLPDVIRANIKWPTYPTYKIETALVSETHDLDWTVVEQEENPELKAEYTKALKDYDTAFKEATATFNQRLTKAIIDGGVVVNPEEDTEWLEQQEYLGIGTSKNSKQRKYDYIISTILGGDEDLYALIGKVMELTGVPKEQLETAQNMFRGNSNEGAEEDTTQGIGA